MFSNPLVATLHAWMSIIGVFAVATVSLRWEHSLWACSYLCGCEVLWRAAGAVFLWEGAKYGIIAVAVITLIRYPQAKKSMWPLVYIGALAPGSIATAYLEPFAQARQLLSANCSGPIVLAICCLAFGGRITSQRDVARCLLAFVGPTFALGITASLGAVSLSADSFQTSSNFEASAGYGPNQVATTLAFSALAMFLITAFETRDRGTQALCFALSIYFVSQSSITFSRSGLYVFGISLMISLPSLLRLKRVRYVLIGGCIICTLGMGLAYSKLNRFTEGKLSARFEDTRGTGRDQIAAGDLQVAWETFPWGAGVGRGRDLRRQLTGESRLAHTEYTRMLSEHGVLGLFALLCLVYAAGNTLLALKDPLNAGWSAAMLTFSLLFMLVSATRLALPGLAFALALLKLRFELRILNRAPIFKGSEQRGSITRDSPYLTKPRH